MPKNKYCPICGSKRTHIGLAMRYIDGFFLLPSIWVGFEIVRKCKNGHFWSKRWRQY